MKKQKTQIGWFFPQGKDHKVRVETYKTQKKDWFVVEYEDLIEDKAGKLQTRINREIGTLGYNLFFDKNEADIYELKLKYEHLSYSLSQKITALHEHIRMLHRKFEIDKAVQDLTPKAKKSWWGKFLGQ